MLSAVTGEISRKAVLWSKAFELAIIPPTEVLVASRLIEALRSL